MQVPAYMLVQVFAAIIVSVVLRLMFGGRHEFVPVTAPTGSNIQSLVTEFTTTFYLVFVVMAVATDDRAVRTWIRPGFARSARTYTVYVDFAHAGGIHGRGGRGRNHHA